MSSFTRTLERRALKRLGYTRQTVKVVNDTDGTPRVVPIPKGERPIINPNNVVIGLRYPTMRKHRIYVALLERGKRQMREAA